MGSEVAEELKGKSWDERFSWVNKVKDQGNQLFKDHKFEEAVDTYLKALCGLDFGD